MQDAIDCLTAFHERQGPVSGRGLEALIAGAVSGVSKKTWILPGRREAGSALLRGASEDRLHCARPYRVLPASPDPAQRALQAVGMAIAGESTLVFLGTGSMSYGAVLEAMSLAAIHKAKVCFVVAWYTRPEAPFSQQLAVSPAVLAKSLGLSSMVVNGRDATAIAAAVQKVQLVEAQL